MQLLADFVILSLATFGLTYLVSETEGPWSIFFRLSDFLRQVKHNEDSGYIDAGEEVYITRSLEVNETGFFYKLYDCFWCFSTWTAIIVVGLYWLIMGNQIGSFPFAVLGAVGVSGFLYEMLPNG